MSDEPPNLVLELLRQIRTTQEEQGRDLAALRTVATKIERRVPAIEFNITRIRRENASDAETAMVAIADHDDRLVRIEEQLGLRSR